MDKPIRTGVIGLGALGASMARHLEPADFVYGPVSGGVAGVDNGTPAVTAGGESANIVRIMPVLEVISASVTHMEPVVLARQPRRLTRS